MLNEFLKERQEKETRLKEQRVSKPPTKLTKEASSQCEHLETVNCKNTSDVAIQTDFPVEVHVIEDLKDQVKALTKIVAELTALKTRAENTDLNRTLFGEEDALSDSLNDILPFEEVENCSKMPSRELPAQSKSVLNPMANMAAIPDFPLSPTIRPPLLPSPPPPMDRQNKAPQILQMRSPLSTVDQNIRAPQRAYDNYGPTDEQRRKTEALVSMGSNLITTAMACVDVLFTDEELASSNTSGTGGYRQLDELKMRFLASSLRRKFESPVFTSQWDDVRARINTKCRGKRRTAIRRLQKQANF